MTPQRRRFLRTGILVAASSALGARVLAQGERIIRITARKFEYEPSAIELRKDEPVLLELVSADVTMGFNVPAFKVRTDIVPGQVARVRLKPDQAGTFDFYCDVFCGDFHEDMSGTIRVTA
ncbi:MAG TPA: cupredoxin domain-containing protein [Burkholderiales bacterium]|nr:cupredoxin domain-containing protein [Burkholderiales bacterium]